MTANADKETKTKSLNEFTLLDDRFFTAVLKDNKQGIQDILQVILDKPDLIVEHFEVQGSYKNLRGRSLVMDVEARDSLGRQYNIEMQNDNAGAIPKRARYHASLLDANSLQPGQKVNSLAESYVIFITRNDVLGGNRPIYHIDRVINEMGVFFNDCSHIIYVNCSWKLGASEEDMLTPLEKLISDMRCAEPAKMHYKSLSVPAEHQKNNPEGDGIMNDDLFQDMYLVGMARGREEARSDLLKRIQEENLTFEQVKELLAEPSKESVLQA